MSDKTFVLIHNFLIVVAIIGIYITSHTFWGFAFIVFWTSLEGSSDDEETN